MIFVAAFPCQLSKRDRRSHWRHSIRALQTSHPLNNMITISNKSPMSMPSGMLWWNLLIIATLNQCNATADNYVNVSSLEGAIQNRLIQNRSICLHFAWNYHEMNFWFQVTSVTLENLFTFTLVNFRVENNVSESQLCFFFVLFFGYGAQTVSSK